MKPPLAYIDWVLVLESLQFTKQKFQAYGGYPSYEMKRERIAEVEQTIAAIRALRDSEKETA